MHFGRSAATLLNAFGDWHMNCIYKIERKKQMRTKTKVKAGIIAVLIGL